MNDKAIEIGTKIFSILRENDIEPSQIFYILSRIKISFIQGAIKGGSDLRDSLGFSEAIKVLHEEYENEKNAIDELCKVMASDKNRTKPTIQ